MKVAIVLITRWTRASIDLDGYCHALHELGHQPILVCLGDDSGGPADFPVVETTDEEMRDPHFWAALQLDTAIIFNWLRKPWIVSAMRSAQIRVVCRADGDGQCSVRVFPGAAWLATVDPARHIVDKLRRAKHWANRFFFLSREEDAEMLDTARAASAIAIESPAAAANLRAIFDYYGEEQLSQKIRIVPHSVQALVLQYELDDYERPLRIFCGGRWDDPQKDAPLLVRVIERLAQKHPHLEILVAGPCALETFADVAGFPQVDILGPVPRRRLIEVLADCRFLLSSSRWETQPIGTLEAFCLGATVVAPPLPGFLDLAANGRFGTLAKKRSVDALVQATEEEIEKWDSGIRDPDTIAAYWRPRVSNEAVVQALIADL